MRVTAILQERYRGEIGRLGDEAAKYVSEYVKAVRSQFPDASVADIREAARDAIEDALYVFGDQAGELACALFDEVCEREGIDAQSIFVTDTISREMMNGKLHYFAGRLVEGDVEGFDRKVSDLTRFYVKRTAYENMVCNCDMNDIRYARVPSGLETCGFCFMLSSRGFVYHSELTARGDTPHGMHDHCDCIIVPGEKGATVIDGYDPEGMADRLAECESALGGDEGIKREWKSLTEDERSSYKGENDNERYKRFKSDRIMREIESRDWKWLYSDDPDYFSPIAYDPEWTKYESETATLLSRHGFEVDPIARSSTERRPDFYLNGQDWEMKNPENKGYMPIWNQFKSAVYGHSKRPVRNPQSSRLVIGGTRSGMTLDEMEKHVLDVSNDFKDTFPEIKEVLLVTKEGTRRIKR